MEKKIITFIIPSYNVEQYLSVALDSFICPEVMDKIEVLIINDGSTDATEKVAMQYVAAHPDVFRLINKDNGGHGSAINTGSRAAAGKYLKVIDADDWVVTENLPQLIGILERTAADVILTPYHTIDIGTGEKKAYGMTCQDYDRTYELKEMMSRWDNFHSCFLFHGIGYRTEFYQTQDIQLSEGIFYEDHEYSTLPCSRATSIQPINLFIYEYAIGNANQSVADVNKLKRIGDIEKVALRLAAYGSQEKDPYAYEYIFKKAKIVILSYYAVACIINPKKLQGFQMCKQFNRKLISVNEAFYVGVRKKYRIFLLMGGGHLNARFYNVLLHSKAYRELRPVCHKNKNYHARIL